MKLDKLAGATSEIWQLFIQDSSSTTGAGLTGLAYNTASLTAYYHRDTDTSATAIALVTMTAGTFTSSGFVEIDSTHMPGWYQFCPPNAALASGAKSCGFHLKGATNMAPVAVEVQLVAYNPDDSVSLGLSAVKSAGNVKKNTALNNFMFLMTDSTNHNPVTGKTVSVSRSIDGGAFGGGTLSVVTEIANGIYAVNFGSGDLNGNVIVLLATASGCDNTYERLITFI